MTLPASGAISMSAINIELNYIPWNGNIWMSHQWLRDLSYQQGNPMYMNNFHGKTKGGTSSGGGDDGGGSTGQCVAVESFLPDGKLAGDIVVGDTMMLADDKTLEPADGTVTMSERSTQLGYRIRTYSGASLVCSESAPIPTLNGYMKPAELLGQDIAVRRDSIDGMHVGWETVDAVEELGDIEVQQITVGDKCFWAGEQAGVFILHHNLKQIYEP